MQTGLKRIKKDHRQRSYRRTFGAVAQLSIPDEFDLDLGLSMPDQNALGLPFGCTGMTQTDLCSNEDGVLYDDYRFTYAKTPPGTFFEGRDLRTSLKTVCQVGVKFISEPDSAALLRKRSGYYDATDGFANASDGIKSAMYFAFTKLGEKRCVSVGTPWMNEWFVGSDGLIPAQFNWDKVFRGHNWEITGWTKKKDPNSRLRFKVKSWQGESVGDKGWLYMLPETLDAVLKIKDTGAFIVGKAQPEDIQNVKLTLIEKLLSYLRQAVTLLQQELEITNHFDMEPTTPNGEKMYETAKNLLGSALAKNPILGCAESVNYIAISAIGKPIGGGASTAAMLNVLKTDKRFEEVDFEHACAGDIIINATGTSQKPDTPLPHGHVGVIGYHHVVSNNSETGLLDQVYTLQSWRDLFEGFGGYPTRVFRIL